MCLSATTAKVSFAFEYVGKFGPATHKNFIFYSVKAGVLLFVTILEFA